MKYNLLFFTLICISNYGFSQILPSYHAVHHKPDGIIESNLILHLDASNSNSLNENDLTIWNDLSSSNNNFTIKNGSVSYSSEGGGSLEFDGYDYFCINPISNFNSTNLTISLWIKVTNVTNRVGVLAQSSRTPTDITNEFQFQVKSSNGKLNFWDHDGSYGFGSTLSNNSTYENPNIWKYVTFTKDGTSGKYYINNSFNGSTTADHNVNYGLDWFCIGRDYRHDSSMPSGKSNRYGFEGYISTVYIYSSTQTSDQITQNYNATKSRYGH
tara:strand:+ start:60 stop:869 length:810 start_codon:yes stop_codon:yes gene_type:complete